MKNSNKLILRQLSQEEQDEIFQRVKLLTTVGKQIEGTSPAVDITKKPEYFDESKFDSAQKAVDKWYLGVSMASTLGLLLLLQLEEILLPLLQTGKSRTVPDLYDRYSATIKYIKRCYETRFYDPESEGWRYINIVRSMHQRIHKIMNENEENRKLIPEGDKDNAKYVWVNQYDMAVTQFAFIGFFMLKADKCGAKKVKQDEMCDVIYFWRLLSYYFGIEDRFNLFVYHEDLAKQMRLLELIFDQYREQLDKPRKQVAVNMAEGVLLAFQELSKDVSMNIVEHHWFKVISVTGRSEVAPYEGMSELMKLTRFQIVFVLGSNNGLIRRLLVRLYKRKLENFCKNGEKKRKRLAKKYPTHIYELNQLQTNSS